MPLAQTALQKFGQSPDVTEKINLAFGTEFDSRSGHEVSAHTERLYRREPHPYNHLIDSLLTKKTLPIEIEILPGGQVQVKGAFSGDKIYLSEELVNPETANLQESVNVLLEEMGHFLDSQINTVDAPGDEGAIFAKLIQNQPFAAGELAALQAENDWGILKIDGEEIEVEQASLEPGIFQVDSQGKVSVDFLADAGSFHNEMAIFSLTGMEQLELGSIDFIQEAARRALSNSNLGRIVIKDAIEGAKFDGELGEGNKTDGQYAGLKTFDFTHGDRLAIMLVPHGTVAEVFKNPQVDEINVPYFRSRQLISTNRFNLDN